MTPLAEGPATSRLPHTFTLLQVVPALEGGGVERATLDMARAVAAAGGRSLVASSGGGLEGALAGAGGELVRLPLQARDPVSLAVNAGRLARVIRSEAVSLVHVRSRGPAFSAIRAARRTGVPVVATYHGVYAAASPTKRWYNGVMTRADLTIANSAFTRDHVLAEHPIAPDRLVVVPEGVDARAFDPAVVSPERVAAIRRAWGLDAGDRRPILLVAARLTGWKGHRVAIEAAARVPSAVLILSGKVESGSYAEDLRALAARLGVADRSRIVPPTDDMAAALLAADLALAPSTAAESFGRGVVEAAAMARLAIASDLGAHRETVVDGVTGWLAPVGDPAAWARRIEAALALAPEARRAMERAARARATRLYGLEAMAEATFDLYRRLAHP